VTEPGHPGASNPARELRLAASLWSVQRAQREAVARRLIDAGLARWHWDVADGSLGNPGGFDPEEAARLAELGAVDSEAHLMVHEPARRVPHWAALCDTIVVHREATGWREGLEAVRECGRTPVVAISPSAPISDVSSLPPEVGVLVMSVPPGGAGSTFAAATLDRLAALRGRELLGVDGGVTFDLAGRCVRHGATWLVSGTDLCGATDPGRWIDGVAAQRD
jgi:ribulose-phosphate 3-epimerase